MSENDKIIAGHEYDGIKELDNPLPKWWLFTFYITIIFSVIYFGYYEFAGGPSTTQELEVALEKIETQKQKYKEEEPAVEVSKDSAASILANQDLMTAAKNHYEGKCAACHGTKGEGLVGPNLTDNYWLHSKGDVEGIVTALKKGFPEKGMPPWEDMIPAEYHTAIAIYIKNLPPVPGKEAQGELVE